MFSTMNTQVSSQTAVTFHPHKGCRTAINQALKYANEGNVYANDLEQRKFFDTVNHIKMLQVLSKTVKAPRVMKAIRKMLRVKVMKVGKCIKAHIVLLQGRLSVLYWLTSCSTN